MKSGLKRSGKSTSKPPSRGKERSTDKPSSVASKTDRSSRATANSKATSQSASRKHKSTSSKGKSASVPKSRPASTLRATGKTSDSLANKKVNFRSKSQSPKSKFASRTNTSKPPSKPTTPKNQHKKPAAKPPSSKNAAKTKKPEASKSPNRSASPSPKRSETPDKATQKTKAKAISKTGKQAEKPKTVEARRSTRSKDQAKKPREAESRSESRPKKDEAKGKASPKEKASPSKKKESKQTSPKMNVEEEAKVEEIATEKKMEVVGEMDLLVPDPVSEFIRDSEGHLVQKLTDQDREIMLRMSLEEILEDDNYEVAIKMINNEPQPSRKSGAREEQKLQVPKEGAEDEDGYIVLEYTLFEDWRLLEAALAYKEVKGSRGLGSRKVWGSMLDPATGEVLFDGKRTMRSLVNRYSLFIAHLSESEQQMIQELGNSLPEHRMRRLRGQYSKASGQNRLLGIVEQIYDAPEQRMWLNPSTTRNQNAKPVTIDEFVKKSVEKSRGRMMEEEEEEEEEVEEKKVQTTSRPKKPASKEKAPKKKSVEKPKARMVEEKEDEVQEEEKIQTTSRAKKPANKERQPRKKSTSKEKTPQKGSASRERTPQKGSVSKERTSQKSSVSKERLPQKRSISKEKVRDIETEKMLIAQRNYLKLKELQAATRVREEEDTNEQRKKFKNNAGKEVARHRQVQEQPQQPEKKLTKKEKAQLREQRRNEQELKQLKDTWVYDANSLSLSEVFSARKPLTDIDVDPTLSLYVDFDEGFRQFVRDMGIKKANKVSERDMKWARLSKYAKEYGLPLSEIISIFNRVSCDNQDLELFLNSGDEGLLWTDQEDRDLLNNDQIALRYLVKIKGPLRIKKRREFLLKLT